MKSTDYLVAMQKNAGSHSMDQIALGGPNGSQALIACRSGGAHPISLA